MTDERHKRAYDAFGPWVTQVTDQFTVPPVFDTAFTYSDDALLVFKIPRPVERRRLSPGTPLYDYLVALYEDRVLVLERNGNAAAAVTILYPDILAIQNSHDLLYSNLILHLRERTLAIPYNSVGQDIIDSCIGLIRDRFAVRTFPLNLEAVHLGAGTHNTFYHNLADRITRDDSNLRLIGCQPGAPVTLGISSLLHRLLPFTRERELQPTMLFCSQREMLLVERTQPMKKPKHADYGYVITCIALERIAGFRLEGPSRYHQDEDIVEATILAGTLAFGCYINHSGNAQQLAQQFNGRTG
ncbi:hypothetical protein [Spirochaeta africana]|uniref:Uncharacterized protein n=1 Tax=Spirochaeta africana (strain ATCC 700263 / DSM 8902 / Z-7692) TaxID=889378 RepID=H9UL24_SPIAZ|nr:hypothetical protein [Spirochaeta africana]AFG38217.1 hypothetical protein Spiaf_2181 [Spirochaeta africana DSM 8902]